MSFQNVTVPYCELVGSERRSLGEQGSTIDRIVLVDWELAPLFVSQITTKVEIIGSTQQITPANYHPIYKHLRVIGCTVEGLGQATRDEMNLISYPKARIVITYADNFDEIQGGESGNVVYITETRAYTYEHKTIKERNAFFFMKFPYQFIDFIRFNGIVPLRGGVITGPPGPYGPSLYNTRRGRRTQVPAHIFSPDDIDFNDPVPGASQAIIKPMAEITITIHFWHDYPEDDIGIMGLIGHVNADWYRPLLCTYPPHTLLLQAVNRNRQFTTNFIGADENATTGFAEDAESWQIEFKFLFNKFGWNTVYRAATTKDDQDTGVVFPNGEPRFVNRRWPAGWYMIATADLEGNMIFPYTPAIFSSFLLPQGYRPRGLTLRG